VAVVGAGVATIVGVVGYIPAKSNIPTTLSPTAATFGQIIAQKPGVFGRQVQYTGRIIF